MPLLSLLLLLDIRRNASARGLKLSRGVNNTFILKPRATNGVLCPANLPDTNNCLSVQGGVATAIGEATVDADIEGAINSYLTACPASQCQEDCVTFITAEGKTVDVAGKGDLAAGFGTNCPLPSAVNTQAVACPGTGNDADTCTSLYSDVLTEVDKSSWNGENIVGKVNLFTSSCLATSCDNDCFDVISDVNLVSHYTSFRTSFVEFCTPATNIEQSSDSIKSENQQSDNQQSGGQQSDSEESNDSNSSEEKGNNDKGGDWGFLGMKPSFTLLSILFGTYLLQSLLH
jgi:hypothetical protein